MLTYPRPLASYGHPVTLSRKSWFAVAAVVLVVGLWWWLRDVLPPSLRTLEHRASDLAGVAHVDVEEPEGDDAIPFQHFLNEVTVTMDGNATADQVKDVLHAYDDDIDDGDVGSVELTVPGAGGARATLRLGQEVHVDDAAVDEVVDAVGDPQVRSYVREVSPGGRSTLTVTLRQTSLRDAVAYAEQFADGPPVRAVDVVSGPFYVRRQLPSGEQARALRDRRTQVALRLDERYDLDEVLLVDRATFVVRLADPSERRAVRDYLAGLPTSSEVGTFRVTGPI